MISLFHYVFLSFVLFVIGFLGIIIRKNMLVLFMSIEILMNSANLLFLAFSRHWNSADGHIVVFFVIAVAAVEAALGLGIVLALFRKHQTVQVDSFSLMKH